MKLPIVLIKTVYIRQWLISLVTESLQQDSSNQSGIVMIKLYCCGIASFPGHPLALSTLYPKKVPTREEGLGTRLAVVQAIVLGTHYSTTSFK